MMMRAAHQYYVPSQVKHACGKHMHASLLHGVCGLRSWGGACQHPPLYLSARVPLWAASHTAQKKSVSRGAQTRVVCT